MVGTTLAAMFIATSDIYKTDEFDDTIAGRVELEIVRMIEVRKYHQRMNQTYLDDSKKMNIKGQIKNNTSHFQELNGPLQHCMKMTKEEDNREFKGEEPKSELRALFQSSTGGMKDVQDQVRDGNEQTGHMEDPRFRYAWRLRCRRVCNRCLLGSL